MRSAPHRTISAKCRSALVLRAESYTADSGCHHLAEGLTQGEAARTELHLLGAALPMPLITPVIRMVLPAIATYTVMLPHCP